MGVDLFQDLSYIMFWLVVVAPVTLYLPTIEYLWNGKTLGKAALKLKVLRADGSAPSLGDIILRWLVRPIDVKLGFLLLFFVPRSPSSQAEEVFMIWFFILMVIPMPLVGIISMSTSPLGQRLGDRLANTVVIKFKNIYSLEDTILRATGDTYEPRFKNVLQLRDKDIYIIKHTIEEAEKESQLQECEKVGRQSP